MLEKQHLSCISPSQWNLLIHISDSSIAENEIGVEIFKCTVLGAYWELGARKGTRITARNGTFSSFRWFLAGERFLLSFCGKTFWTSLKNRTFVGLRFTGISIPASDPSPYASRYDISEFWISADRFIITLTRSLCSVATIGPDLAVAGNKQT